MICGNVQDVDKGLSPMEELKFHELMAVLRKNTELAAVEVSRRAGLSPSYFSKVESGTLKPTVSAFARIVHVLGASPSEIAFLLQTLRHDEENH